MTKTLYFRVIVLFLAIVVSALAVGFYIFITLYNGYLQDGVKKAMTEAGQRVAAVYGNSSAEQRESMLEGFLMTKTYFMNVYKLEAGQPVYVPVRGTDPFDVAPSILSDALLKGEAYAGASDMDPQGGDPALTVAAVPFKKNGQPHVVLLRPDWTNKIVFNINVPLLIMLLLVPGSILLFLVSTKYVMKPLKDISKATRRIAKGDFDVHIEVHRDDEMGMLASHFNRMAAELKNVEAMRREFVSNVSHEIQSPLTSIRGFSQALQSGLVEDEEKPRYYTMIRTESERLSRLCDNLLKLASLESGKHPLYPKNCNVAEQLRQIVIATEPQWSAKQLRIDVQAADSVVAEADEDQLVQVWRNLLDNAMKFTPHGGSIDVRLTASDTEVEVTIADSGQGVPEAELERVFDRFYKGDKARSRKREGNGLGLSIVKRIVDLHGGTIGVHNGPQGGAVFTVTLPRRRQAGLAASGA